MKKAERNAYWLSMFGQNVLYCIISTGLTYYLQNIIFIPVAFLGLVISTAQVLDAVKDPVMGLIIDKTRSKHGKCKVYLIWGVWIAAVATILPFINATYGDSDSKMQNAWILAWVFVTYFLWVLAFTFIDVPLWSLASCITPEKEKRENLLMGARVAAGIAGGLVPLVIVPLAQTVAGLFEKRQGYEKALKSGTILIAIALTVISALLMIPNNVMAKERVVDKKEKSLSIREILTYALSDRSYRRLLLSGVLRSPIMILGITEMTMFSYYYGNNGREPYVACVIFLGGGYLLGQILSTMVSPKLSARFGKRKLYIMISILTAVACAFFWVYYRLHSTSMTGMAQMVTIFFVFLLEGSGVGILNYLQSVMIVDCVDGQAKKTGIRLDGIYMSGQSFVIKISTGIATLITSACYGIAGFTDANIQKINELLHQGADFRSDPAFAPYRDVIFFVCSVPAAISLLLSVLPFLHRKSD